MNDLASLLASDITDLAGRHPVTELAWPDLNQCGLRFAIKRDDLLHPLASGNKLYKLWGHLQRARAQKSRQLLSFGGAYSNHLHALAAVGQALGIATHGIVRGNVLDNVLENAHDNIHNIVNDNNGTSLTPTLQDCKDFGMTLHFVNRLEYREKHEGDTAQQLARQYSDLYSVPEGGGGEAGSDYCGALMSTIETSHAHDAQPGNATLCVPCGTATTFQGLLKHSTGKINLRGFSAVKASRANLGEQEPQLSRDTRRFIEEHAPHITTNWHIDYETARRGFARADDRLLDFIADFYEQTGVPLEPVYTGKMLLRILELAQQGHWPDGHRIIALHTGGLQGLRGYPALAQKLSETNNSSANGICHA